MPPSGPTPHHRCSNWWAVLWVSEMKANSKPDSKHPLQDLLCGTHLLQQCGVKRMILSVVRCKRRNAHVMFATHMEHRPKFGGRRAACGETVASSSVLLPRCHVPRQWRRAEHSIRSSQRGELDCAVAPAARCPLSLQHPDDTGVRVGHAQIDVAR